MAPHNDNPWAREAEENTRGSKSDILGMEWKTGEHTIRIAPPIKKAELPFAKYIVHWVPVKTGKKDRPIVHGIDTKCPICKFVYSLYAEIHRLKEEEDLTDEAQEIKKIQKQISKLRGKKTYDMNIIDRGDFRDENGKIKIKRLVAGPGIWKPILELGNSDKWGNPSSAGSRGYDLTITVDGEGIKREYTVLPDPERKALTKDELDALEKFGYDLAKLRKFSTVKEILDILENAKHPLDELDLKKIKRELLNNEDFVGYVDEDNISSKKNKKSDKTEEDSSEDNTSDEEEDEKMSSKNKKDIDKEKKAFADDDSNVDSDTDDNESGSDDSDSDSKNSSDDDSTSDSSSDDEHSSDEISLKDMDCRGTHDSDDIGCKECSISDECKKLQKEFSIKAEKFDIDIDGMSGSEIEKIIKKKEEASKRASTGKVGKSGKTGSSNSNEATTGKKRNLPF
jgi:hypothetical protein